MSYNKNRKLLKEAFTEQGCVQYVCFRSGLKTFPEITNKERDSERGGRKNTKVDQGPVSLRQNKRNYGTHKKNGGKPRKLCKSVFQR